MSATKILLLCCTIGLLTGCVGRQAFYVSPYNGLNNPYHTIPVKKDSTTSAFYINGALAFGSANDYATDRVFAANATVSHSLNFGNFQAFYGLGFSAGSYKVDRFDEQGNNETVDPDVINANAGKKSFSGYGFDGGINYVMPFRNGEWRIIGFETSLRKESGGYLNFRETLPSTAATLIISKDFYGTAGGFSEIIGYSKDMTYGFKFGFGSVLGREYHVRSIRDSDITGNGRLSYHYVNVALHFSKQKWTGFAQLNQAS